MKTTLQRISLVAVLVSVSAAASFGQVTAGPSGVPGDDIPDVYYFQETGLLQVDTDGQDFVALLVSDTSATFFDNCILCDGGGIDFPPPPGHFYTVGNINDASQWIRTFPLSGDGPQGVYDLAMGTPGLTQSYFTEIFDDTATEDLWSFRFATNDSGQFFSNVTVIVPEPATFSLLGVAGLALLGLRRR